MQPGSSYPNRRNNTHATSGEPIDIDQRSITFGDLHPDESYEHGLHYDSQSPPPTTSSYLPPYLLNSDPMGQGASTPRDESNNTSSRNHEREAGNGTLQQGVAGVDPERAAAAARLRRSRRIRNHIEHFTRLGNRLMPSSSATTAAAATPSSSSSSGPSSSSNPSTIRGRVPGLRFRARSNRLSGSARSRSPSPPRRGGSTASGAIRRRTPPLPRPTVSSARRATDPVLGDMMDISPVSTVTPQPRASAAADVGASATPSRRSRMSRVRDSINLMSSELNSMLNRPGSRRPSETRAGALDALNGTHRESPGTEAPARDTDSIFPPAAEEPSIQGGTSIFGSGPRDPQGILDGLGNPGRIRPGEDQAAMLSRLLSVAAAATAASLVGDAEEAITQAQDVGGDNGGDGSFESFLRALRNGRLEAALRNGGNEMGGGNAADPNAENGVLSLNFFRMFRFGSTPGNSGGGEDGEEGGQGSRMVPVIIVGIRSVSPRESTDGDGPRPAPFFDALANLSIPSVHRRSRLGSAGAGGSSGTRPRPASMGSPIAPSRPLSSNDAATEPPQATPAATSESGTTTRERSNTTGTPNRPTAPEGTRSWIIYVLGGSYPENHPILTTPSLFTDEPTYEDMTLLSSLLGPAKLPVAAKEDLDSAGGVFTFGEGSATQYGPGNAERCLICLSDYETGAECRQIVKCNHIFHKECIDEWLTTGRNSCPLCRGEGVEEKSKAAEAAAATPATTTTTTPAVPETAAAL